MRPRVRLRGVQADARPRDAPQAALAAGRTRLVVHPGGRLAPPLFSSSGTDSPSLALLLHSHTLVLGTKGSACEADPISIPACAPPWPLARKGCSPSRRPRPPGQGELAVWGHGLFRRRPTTGARRGMAASAWQPPGRGRALSGAQSRLCGLASGTRRGGERDRQRQTEREAIESEAIERERGRGRASKREFWPRA